MTTMLRPADLEAVRARWGWIFGFGVVIAGLGVIALFNLVDATLVTTSIIGLLLMLAGIVQVAGAFTGGVSAGWRIFQGVLGVLYLIVGFDAFTDPLKGAIAITFVISLMLVVDGAIHVFAAVRDRPSAWWLHAIFGVIVILLGLWLGTGIPYTGVAIGLFVGLMLVFAGLGWIVAGLGLRSLPPVPTAAA